MSQEDNFCPVTNSSAVQEDDFSDSDSDKGDSLPDGAMLPLNSKKLVISQLRQPATPLEISAEGSASKLRQVIDGKLIKLGHEPRNIQVVVSNVDSKLYLVNDSGIIAKEMEHVSNDNVVSEGQASSRDANELPRDVEKQTE